MLELFESYGLLESSVAPETLSAAIQKKGLPVQDLGERGPVAGRVGAVAKKRFSRTVKALQRLSESPLPARAINVLRDTISCLDFDIIPADDSPLPIDQLQNEMRIFREVLESPNEEDKDFPTFIGQIVQDVLMYDAGCWEYVERPRYGNSYLALYPVPGYTVTANLNWNGKPESTRWQQVVEGTFGTSKVGANFKDEELEFIMMRKRSWSLFGLSPLEISIEVMEAWLELAAYQKQVTSDSFPGSMLYLGNDVGPKQVAAFKQYWENDLRGGARPGVFGNSGNPSVLELKPAGDGGLYLIYQDMLVRTLALCFSLKPQDFALVADVNRSTSETSASQSVTEARRPLARAIASRINSRVRPKLASVSGAPNISFLRFRWSNIDPQDDSVEAAIFTSYLDSEIFTIDEVRQELGKPPLPNGIGKLTKTALTEFLRLNPSAGLTEEEAAEILSLGTGSESGLELLSLDGLTEEDEEEDEEE